MRSRGLINSFGAFFRYYDEQLLPEASGTTLGLIGSVQSFFVLLLSVFVGRLLDAQLHRSVVAVGGVLTTLGYLCLSFTSGRALHGEGSYSLVMISHGITAGIGMSCFFVHSSHCVIQVYPPDERVWKVMLTPVVVSWSQILCGWNYVLRSSGWYVDTISLLVT